MHRPVCSAIRTFHDGIGLTYSSGAGMNAFIIGLLITLLTLCFAYQTGAALNPSRDFGPRLALLALGYPKTLFTNPYWLYGPWAGSLAGSALGAFIYDAAVFTGVS